MRPLLRLLTLTAALLLLVETGSTQVRGRPTPTSPSRATPSTPSRQAPRPAPAVRSAPRATPNRSAVRTPTRTTPTRTTPTPTRTTPTRTTFTTPTRTTPTRSTPTRTTPTRSTPTPTRTTFTTPTRTTPTRSTPTRTSTSSSTRNRTSSARPTTSVRTPGASSPSRSTTQPSSAPGGVRSSSPSRQPGSQSTRSRTSSTPPRLYPSTRPSTGTSGSRSSTSTRAPTAVGGSVRGTNPGKLTTRDLYSTTRGTRTRSNTPGDTRPTTGRSLVNLYGDARSDVRTTPSSATGASRPRPNKSTSATRPSLVDRYTPNDRPRKGSGRTGSGRPSVANTNIAANRPALNPRSDARSVALSSRRNHALIGTRGVTQPVRVASRTLGGACYGPIWDPCHSWGYSWDPCWSSGLTWTLGSWYGSFCWGWSAWYPWHCYRTYRHYYSGAWSWFTPCYDPFAPVIYNQSTVYIDAEPSDVVVVSDDVGEVERRSVGRRALTAAEEAQRYVDLGDYYFREGRYRDAADAYVRARSLAPEDATVHLVLADAVFACADYHFAAYLINEALRLDPGLAFVEADKRLLYGKLEDFERQMQTLIRYIDEKSYDAMAHLVLGYNLKFSEMPQEARKAFERVLEIDPENEAAKLFLEGLNHAERPTKRESSDKD
jgi:hypothetical protein